MPTSLAAATPSAVTNRASARVCRRWFVTPRTEHVVGRRRARARRLPLFTAGGLALAVALAGCGGGGSAAPPATTATAPSVVHSAHRSVTIAELRASIDRLYRDHSGIGSFTARDVSYTPATRDKVLSVCQKGGPETDPNTLEAAKLAGCAPLVFFFYRYGRRAAVPDSIEIARNIYWYAADNVRGPFDARNALNVLLQRWGIP